MYMFVHITIYPFAEDKKHDFHEASHLINIFSSTAPGVGISKARQDIREEESNYHELWQVKLRLCMF